MHVQSLQLVIPIIVRIILRITLNELYIHECMLPLIRADQAKYLTILEQNSDASKEE